ncbi:MAG: macro domain-containing protein [Candidatus Hodarchaeaceae archaeon]|nr:macro domain-containing protein [Candidatus Hodarchaeaceae archaeon]
MIKFDNITVRIKRGDLTKERVDAICNPANSLMLMGGGAAGAIKRAGGKGIEEEALKHAPVSIGKAVATAAGRLRARWVIHAPTMAKPAMRTSSESVYLATKAALECAEKMGAKNFAIPGMETGIGGVSFDAAAGAMVKALRDFGPISRSLKEIVLCDLSEEMVGAWARELTK